MSGFKPGDLIADEDGSQFYVIAPADPEERLSALDADGSQWHVRTLEGARRLVVIDPEDREDCERLVRAYLDCGDGIAELSDEPWSLPGMRMKAALREFANPKPPRHEEPTGHAAVVEDSEGRRWINWRDPRATGEHERPWVLSSDSYTAREWRDIAVARVLSEGVTP